MQALSDLASENEAAAAYIHADADITKQSASDKQSHMMHHQKEAAEEELSWKWDILRPIKNSLLLS